MTGLTVDAKRACPECGSDISDRHPLARYCGKPCKKRSELRRDRDVRRERTREFMRKNPSYSKAWAAENIEARREAVRRSYRKHQARRRAENAAWESRNPTAHILRNAQRRARLTGASAALVTTRDLSRLVARYGGRCAYCDRLTESPHFDHVVPLALGGSHSIGNLLPACSACNLSKGSSLLAAWLRRSDRMVA